MSDKKNFSALGKIDGKYVEEADAYSVASEGGRSATKRRRIRASAVRAAGIAAAAAIIFVCGIFVFRIFSENSGLEKNTAAAPEAEYSTETADRFSCDSAAVEGETDDDAAGAVGREESSSEASDEESSEE